MNFASKRVLKRSMFLANELSEKNVSPTKSLVFMGPPLKNLGPNLLSILGRSGEQNK